MEYRKLIAGAAAMLMLASFTGCGRDDNSEDGGEAPVLSAVSDTEEETEAPEEDTAEAPKEKPSRGEKTTTAAKADKAKTTTTATALKSSYVKNTNVFRPSPDSKVTTKKASSSSGNTTTQADYGIITPSGTQTVPQQQTPAARTTAITAKPSPAVTTAAPQAPEEEVKQYDGEVIFSGEPNVKGNITSSGSVVRITSGGDYYIKGSCNDGQIVVDTETEQKVEITLDGVDLTCSDGPAIFVNEAKKCVIKLADGSSNYLSDGGNDKTNDGVIFSNDTLRLKGSGKLEINSGNAHGIASDDDIIIESGEYLINSIKSGLFAHDDITINGGELTIFGGTNGIKSKGTVNINGGTAWVCGGVKEEKSSVYAGEGLYYTGGTVFAAGNMVTAPAESSTPYIVVDWGKSIDAGKQVSFLLNGDEKATLLPKNPFRCVMMLSDSIEKGDVFTPVLDGREQGDFDVSNGQNLFKVK